MVWISWGFEDGVFCISVQRTSTIWHWAIGTFFYRAYWSSNSSTASVFILRSCLYFLAHEPWQFRAYFLLGWYRKYILYHKESFFTNFWIQKDKISYWLRCRIYVTYKKWPRSIETWQVGMRMWSRLKMLTHLKFFVTRARDKLSRSWCIPITASKNIHRFLQGLCKLRDRCSTHWNISQNKEFSFRYKMSIHIFRI